MAEKATPKEKLAALVQELRGRTSQRRFAKIVGVSNQTVSLWEQARMWPDDENLKKLAELKGWSFEELLFHLEGDPADEDTAEAEAAKDDAERVPSLQQMMAIIRMGKSKYPISPNLSSSSNQATLTTTLPCVLKGHPPDVTSFYGREPELALLKEAVTEKHCVVLVGPEGIGKTALAAKLLQDIKINQQPQFDCLVWKSIHYAPAIDNLLTDLLYSFSEATNLIPIDKLARIEDWQDKTTLLIELLKVRRCLLVLDAAEVILKGDRETFNPYGEYKEYGEFIRRIIEEQHKSCLLLTSQKVFVDIEDLRLKARPAQLITIKGLGKEALQLFEDKGLLDRHMWRELSYKYRGNPYTLQIIADRIKEMFNGSVEKFLKLQSTLIDNKLQAKLSEPEKKVILYLAEELDKGHESIAFVQLLRDLKAKEITEAVSDLATTVSQLSKESLIEKAKDINGELHLSLEPQVRKTVLKEYKIRSKSLSVPLN